MKHISLSIYILVAALSMGNIAHCTGRNVSNASQEVSAPTPAEANKIQPLLEVKGGYFFFSDAKMRKVYDQGGLDVQISGSYPVWKWLQAYCTGRNVSNASQEVSAPTPAEANKIQPLLEVKGGYFFFSDAKMRKVYDQGGLDVQISGSYPVWKWLQVYGSVEYLQRHGRSLNGHQKTSIWEVPLSLGLKPVIEICEKINYYVTLGPRYFFVHQHNHSSYVDRSVSQNGLGGFVNTGFNFFPCPHFLVDVFGEYSYKRMHFHDSKHHVYGRTIQVGGFAFGVGLGYAF